MNSPFFWNKFKGYKSKYFRLVFYRELLNIIIMVVKNAESENVISSMKSEKAVRILKTGFSFSTE